MFQLDDYQIRIQETARTLAVDVFKSKAAGIDASEEYPWDNVKSLTQAGFMGMAIPEKYGGLGLSYFDVVLVVEEIARVCGVTARIVVEGNMGAIGAIVRFGSKKTNRTYCPSCIGGR